MIVIQFALLMFSWTLLVAAFLAPPEAWLTPIGAKSNPNLNDDE